MDGSITASMSARDYLDMRAVTLSSKADLASLSGQLGGDGYAFILTFTSVFVVLHRYGRSIANGGANYNRYVPAFSILLFI